MPQLPSDTKVKDHIEEDHENIAHMDGNTNPPFNNQQAFLSGNSVAVY